jgi:hypothetical protein
VESRSDRRIRTLLRKGVLRAFKSGGVCVKQGTTWRRLLPYAHKNGALLVSIPASPRTVWLHRIIALAHVRRARGPRMVRALNGNLADTRASNLQWTTEKNVSAIAHAMGQVPHPIGRALPCTKLSRAAVRDIRARLKAGESHRSIARRYSVTMEPSRRSSTVMLGAMCDRSEVHGSRMLPYSKLGSRL